MHQNCVAIFADSCANSQLCNAIGSATGTCIYPISAGSVCSTATPGKLSKAICCCVGSLTVARMRCCRNYELAAKGGLLDMCRLSCPCLTICCPADVCLTNQQEYSATICASGKCPLRSAGSQCASGGMRSRLCCCAMQLHAQACLYVAAPSC